MKWLCTYCQSNLEVSHKVSQEPSQYTSLEKNTCKLYVFVLSCLPSVKQVVTSDLDIHKLSVLAYMLWCSHSGSWCGSAPSWQHPRRPTGPRRSSVSPTTDETIRRKLHFVGPKRSYSSWMTRGRKKWLHLMVTWAVTRHGYKSVHHKKGLWLFNFLVNKTENTFKLRGNSAILGILSF